jgi:hypothetical protein
MASNDDRFSRNTDPDRRVSSSRGMSWGWGILALVVIAIIALYAWDWSPGGAPETTGTVPPSTSAPSTPSAPPASAPSTPAPQ